MAKAHSGLVLLCGTTGGCGILLYPERRGTPHHNQIDWKVAALDGLGLILFFVPGVVAFVVGFYTGAIYLPADSRHVDFAPDATELERHEVASAELQVGAVERVVSDHVGQTISLRKGMTRVSELTQIHKFDEQVDRHHKDRVFGHSLDTFFAPWKQAFGLQA